MYWVIRNRYRRTLAYTILKMASGGTSGSIIKYAYVRYLEDQKRDVVPVNFVKSFSPKHVQDFDTRKAYLVQWSDDLEFGSGGEDVHYKAQILMLGATKSEIEEKMTTSRVRIPKVLDTSVDESSSEDEFATQQTIISKERKERKRGQALATSKSLKAIMAENMAKKRTAPLFSPSVSTDFTEKACSCGYTGKYQAARKRYREAEATNLELEANIKKMKERDSVYQQLNRELQLQLIDQLKGKGKGPSQSKVSGDKKKPPVRASPTPAPDISDDDDLVEEPKYVEKDGKICIGEGVGVTTRQWEALQGQKKHSLFVRDLAVAVWGTEVLKDRSVEGKVCPRFKREARAPLSPNKLNAIKDCFSHRLDEMKVSAVEKEKELNNFKKYIAGKIQDINRLIRKKDN